MLLTRSLPPQFLLPAWSARQLAQATQRARKSSISFNGHPPKPPKLTIRKHERIHKEDFAIWRRPVITDDYLEPERTDSESEPELQQSSEPLSLFDELFPEERQARSRRERAAEDKLDKLPAFKWNLALSVREREEREREKKREQYKTIPRRDASAREEEKSLYDPIRLDNVSELERPREILVRKRRTLPSVLVLNACSKTLEESDFFRLGPRGEHIEGWSSGIIKVIPARDNNTLEKLGHFFILCSSDAAARAYLDRTMALHKLAGPVKALEASGLPLPPGLLKKGEDPEKALQGFTIVPAYGKLSLRLLNRPYRPSMLRILEEGGPAARLAKDRTSGEMVLFFVDMGHISQYDLLQALRDDGKRRNLHWKFGRERLDQIIKLNHDQQDDNLGEPDEGVEESPDSEAYRARKKNGYRRPARYVISFKDRNEARRFVREWHRRPFPIHKGHNLGDEPPPIVNAEILW